MTSAVHDLPKGVVMLFKRFRDLWATIHEPRVITALHVSFYCAMCAAAVMMAIVVPLTTPTLVWVGASAIAATFLSGTVGALAAWRGRWDEERAACLLGCLSAFLNVALCVALYLLSPPFPHEQTFIVVAALGLYGVLVMFIVRYLRVRESPWPPGREPQRARAVAAGRDAVSAKTGRS